MSTRPVIVTFPKTNTAFRLATDYCSIENVLVTIYQSEATFYDEAEKEYNRALSANHSMCDEFNDVMLSNHVEEKEYLINKIKFLVQDERLLRFQLCLYSLIETHNEAIPSLEIPKGKHYTHYIKNGILVANHFLSNANYLLIEKIPNELKERQIISEPTEFNESEKKEKIVVDLTAKEILYLFKSLQNAGIIKNTNATDIFKMVAASFQLKKSSDTKELNIKHLQNTWSQLDAQTAQTWFDKFAMLSNKAKLDNPNKIKNKK